MNAEAVRGAISSFRYSRKLTRITRYTDPLCSVVSDHAEWGTCTPLTINAVAGNDLIR
jgi:hypothetical protein